MGRTSALASAFAVVLLAVGGCSGGGGGSGGPGGNLTVTAHVVTLAGQGVPDIAVWISGQGPFFTDGNGEVVVPGAPVPYTALVIEGSIATADYWPGLTRPDPTFVLSDTSLGAFTADLDGAVMGGVGFPTPPNHETMVMTRFSPGSVGFNSTIADAMTGTYMLQGLGWLGNPAPEFQILAMQYLTDAAGAPMTFTGLGATVLLPISPGANLHQNVPLFPVATDTITGTINAPPGAIAAVFLLTLEVSSGAVVVGPPVDGFTSTLSLKFPVVPALDPGVLILSESLSLTSQMFAWRRGLPVPPTNLTFDLPALTEQILPPKGVTGVDYHTAFQVTPTPGDRVFVAKFSPQGGLAPTIRLHTTASTFSIPDLSSYGMGIPPGADYEWRAEAQGPLASLDEAAVPGRVVGFVRFVSNSPTDAFDSAHASWSFQFAP